MITPQQALQRTIEHREIFFDEMLDLMRQIMRGEISPLMTAAILTGLRVKKETVGEITAAAQVMRELSARIDVADNSNFVDIVGTGGDGSNTFNISTAAMFVAAAAGAKVAKHGNRGVSSKSGSADVLEALGVNLQLSPAQVGECLAATGIGFMFAPNHHAAMKNVAPVRREMGVRTIFNILGPLTNPAGAPNSLLGVCLGHQTIGEAFGGRVVHAKKLMHGKVSPVHHADVGVFRGLPNPITCTRYHSLAIERESLPDCLEITAWTDDGEIMGVRHKTLAVEGVQFHPESILTERGHDMLKNFLEEHAR